MEGKLIAALVPAPSAQEIAEPVGGELLGQMLDRLPDFVFRYRFRPQPRFEYVSAAVTGLTGYTPEEFYADPNLHRRFDHPDDRDVLRETVLSGGKSASPHVRWIRRAGDSVWAEHGAP